MGNSWTIVLDTPLETVLAAILAYIFVGLVVKAAYETGHFRNPGKLAILWPVTVPLMIIATIIGFIVGTVRGIKKRNRINHIRREK